MIKYKFFWFSILLLSVNLISQVLYSNPERMVQQDDPYYKLLSNHLAWMKKNYYKDKVILALYGGWHKVKSKSASILFPDLKFYSISWDEKTHPAAQKKPIGLASGLTKTVGINKRTGKLQEQILCHLQPFKRYGNLLRKFNVGIEDTSDAINVWRAYCDLFNWGGNKNRPIKQISESEWHLGIYSFDDPPINIEKSKNPITIKTYLKVKIDTKSNRVLSTEYKQDKFSKKTQLK